VVSGAWMAGTSYGHPAPYLYFSRWHRAGADRGTQRDRGRPPFTFGSVDVYASVTPIPYEIIGFLGSSTVFVLTGTQPNTYGNFATVANLYSSDVVDRVLIRLTNPATACCATRWSGQHRREPAARHRVSRARLPRSRGSLAPCARSVIRRSPSESVERTPGPGA